MLPKRFGGIVRFSLSPAAKLGHEVAIYHYSASVSVESSSSALSSATVDQLLEVIMDARSQVLSEQRRPVATDALHGDKSRQAAMLLGATNPDKG